MEIGDWAVRLIPGLLCALFFVIAYDWLQTRNLNARRRPRDADDQVVDELPAPASRVYLAAVETCADMGWLVHAADDSHYTLWVINRSPHLTLGNLGLILRMTPYGSGETRITVSLNSPHPGWVLRRFRALAPRLIERLRLRVLEEPSAL